MPRFLKTAIVILLLAAGTTASAGEFRFAPFIGYSTGLTLENTLTGAASGLTPGPEFGLIADFGLGPERWIQLVWSHQDIEFCEGCLPGEPGPLDLKIDSLHLGGMYQPADKTVRPFAVASAGVTLYNPGTGGDGTAAGFSFALGGGADFVLDDWISLGLEGRGWLIFGGGTLYGGCSGGCAIGFSVSGGFQFQAIAAVVIRIP